MMFVASSPLLKSLPQQRAGYKKLTTCFDGKRISQLRLAVGAKLLSGNDNEGLLSKVVRISNTKIPLVGEKHSIRLGYLGSCGLAAVLGCQPLALFALFFFAIAEVTEAPSLLSASASVVCSSAVLLLQHNVSNADFPYFSFLAFIIGVLGTASVDPDVDFGIRLGAGPTQTQRRIENAEKKERARKLSQQAEQLREELGMAFENEEEGAKSTDAEFQEWDKRFPS